MMLSVKFLSKPFFKDCSRINSLKDIVNIFCVLNFKRGLIYRADSFYTFMKEISLFCNIDFYTTIIIFSSGSEFIDEKNNPFP